MDKCVRVRARRLGRFGSGGAKAGSISDADLPAGAPPLEAGRGPHGKASLDQLHRTVPEDIGAPRRRDCRKGRAGDDGGVRNAWGNDYGADSVVENKTSGYAAEVLGLRISSEHAGNASISVQMPAICHHL
jgi:hypothetical protein